MKNKKLILSVVLTIMAVFFASGLRAQEPAAEQQTANKKHRRVILGGPCTYKPFKGTCKIVSVEKTETSKRQAMMNGGPGYEGYEVKFVFTPEETPDFSGIPWVKGSERALLTTQYPLLLTTSWYPSQKFLEKYDIRKDAVFACEMDLITSGTCTPITFKFEGINTTDYSE